MSSLLVPICFTDFYFILLGEEVLVSFSPPPRYLLVWKFVTNFPNDGYSSFDVF